MIREEIEGIRKALGTVLPRTFGEHYRTVWKVDDLIAHIDQLEAELKKSNIDKEVAESIAYTTAHPVDSPCGHSSQYSYTPDGGKHIYCHVCQKERTEAELARVKDENERLKNGKS